MAASKNINPELETKTAEQDPWEIIRQMNERIKDLENGKKTVEKPGGGHRPPPDLSGEKKVKIKLFLDGDKYKDDVFVGINGRTYQIKRGVEVEVPESVAKVLEDSGNQQQYAYTHMRDLQEIYDNNKQPGT